MQVRFYGELNRYLPRAMRGRAARVLMPPSQPVLALLEIFGVPVAEIDLIVVGGEPVDFEYRLKADDRVSLYPRFRSIDLGPLALINRGRIV